MEIVAIVPAPTQLLVGRQTQEWNAVRWGRIVGERRLTGIAEKVIAAMFGDIGLNRLPDFVQLRQQVPRLLARRHGPVVALVDALWQIQPRNEPHRKLTPMGGNLFPFVGPTEAESDFPRLSLITFADALGVEASFLQLGR